MSINLSRQIHVELVGVGYEIVNGNTLDINSPFLARKLMSLGLEVKKITSVGDHDASLAEVIADAKEKRGVIIVSGGLGSTFDDITKKIVSRVLGRTLVLNQKVLDDVENSLKKKGVESNSGFEKQALFPLRSEPLPNISGIAWGFYIKYEAAHFFFLPGVPSELEEMFEKGVVPIIEREFNLPGTPPWCFLKVFGLRESEVERRIQDILKENSEVRFSIRVKFPEVHLELTGLENSERSREAVAKVAVKVENRLFPHIIARNDETIESVVGEFLDKNGLTLFLALSCTGGLLGHRITAVPGSSTYFLGGVIAYNNNVKEKVLGVSAITLNEYGAVSRETAIEMAKCAKTLENADIGLAVTGVAGPGGGSEDKPVGMVFIALYDGESVSCERFRFYGDRDEIKLLSSYWALELLRRYLVNIGAKKDQDICCN